jgi:CheY-like chemotaxis protein
MTMDQDILAASILIVDDQAANVQLLRRLLEETGYTQVIATQDPTQVCALHRRHAHDLILLDIQMPVLDGFGVMEGLKVSAPDSYLPVIVLTAEPAHKLRALQAGAKDFISKPFDLLEVKTRIHNMLEVRLLYRRLEGHNKALELAVQERTAELRESEARYRSLTELASDWYWEQDEHGEFTRASGPVLQILGARAKQQADAGGHDAPLEAGREVGLDGGPVGVPDGRWDGGWDEVELSGLQTLIAARRPFLDFVFHRTLMGGRRQQFRVSGQPTFDAMCRFTGYRGVGLEVVSTR